MVLLDPVLLWLDDVELWVWLLVCVLELESGVVAWFVELGLGVVSVCATAPNVTANTNGRTSDRIRFIFASSIAVHLDERPRCPVFLFCGTRFSEQAGLG